MIINSSFATLSGAIILGGLISYLETIKENPHVIGFFNMVCRKLFYKQFKKKTSGCSP